MKKLWNVAGDIMPDVSFPRPPKLDWVVVAMIAYTLLAASVIFMSHK